MVTVVSTLVEGGGTCVGKTVVDELDYSKRLEYLHEKVEPRTIHRNIKSNNVLLFDDDVAKISNFDLSNQAPKWQHICIPHVFLGSKCLLEFFGAFWVGFLGCAPLVLRLSAVSGGFWAVFNLAIMSSDSIAVKFMTTHSNLMNRNPVPSLDICFGELLHEQQRLTTHSAYQHDKMISNVVTYVAQGKGKGRDMQKECPTRPQNRQANAYHAIVDSASSATTSDFSALTTEKIANGCQLPIHDIGDIDSTIRDVFVSPQLSTSLISVGQLVDNNYDVRFSRDGCLVQDQASGKILAKGSKVGRLFPMHFSIPDVISFACNDVNNKCEVWHKRLGHPNSAVLSHIIISGLLGNKDQFSFPLF
ncbi:hypothetical protein Pint_30529 [Pistacia integerrima]|uniref:Uncharacterized protein n=1 Tax=Pistacia integerrima TaxID=434235 RepID=A0ACC0X0C3_9ROSI|nr:hypothetical protein Pint_30529 [Pistacia integerrima]